MTSFYRSEYISSFQHLIMAEENCDSELLVSDQGQLVYVGQGQAQFIHFHEPTPEIWWPKKKKKKKE
jgi:hypothetical protein